jgi:hypothetical protein
MRRSLLALVCVVGGMTVLPGRLLAGEQYVYDGNWFGKVLSVDKSGDVCQVKIRVYYNEPFFDKKQIGETPLGRRYTLKSYLLTWGTKLKWKDATFQVQAKPAAKIRQFPPPQWNPRTERWDNAPLKGKSKKDTQPGLPADMEDITQDSWITAKLYQRVSDGELYATQVIVYKGYDKVMGPMP